MFGILSFTWYFCTKFFFFPFVTSSIANLRTGRKTKMFGISYAVARPQIPSTVQNFVDILSYTVQIRGVHCKMCWDPLLPLGNLCCSELIALSLVLPRKYGN